MDSFNKTPVPVIHVTHPPNSNWFGEMDCTDGTTRASLRIDSGHMGSTQCTIYVYSRWCNGIFRVRYGEDPSSWSSSDRITKPGYCSDSALPFETTFVFSGLNPGTTYYFDIMAFWSIAQPWQLDSSFTTDTISKNGS